MRKRKRLDTYSTVRLVTAADRLDALKKQVSFLGVEKALLDADSAGSLAVQDAVDIINALIEDRTAARDNKNAPHCDRCGYIAPVRTMSWFNDDMICMACNKRETAHPDYNKARDAERSAVYAGNTNFPGIGKPADL